MKKKYYGTWGKGIIFEPFQSRIYTHETYLVI